MSQPTLINQQRRERTLLLLTLGVLGALVVNLSIFGFRIDLTSAGAWSISEASKSVFVQAKEDVQITYYLSKKLSTYYPVTQSLADFVTEYAAASGGRVKARVVDPQDSGELASMARLGIQGNQINVVEQSQQTQAVVYSGIVLEYLNRRDVMPQVDQLETLEYELTSRLSKLITEKTKTYAFLSTDPSRTLQDSYRIVSNLLGKGSTFIQVQPGEAISSETTALIVAGNRGMTEAFLKPVDDYLMAGGKLFIAADGVFVDIASPQNPALPAGDDVLLKALETWGVKVEQSLLLDSYNNLVQFQSSQGVTLRRYPLWPQVLPQDTAADHPVTARFPGLSLLWASPLTDLQTAGLTVKPLVWTSDKSWVMTENFTIDPDQALLSGKMPGVSLGRRNAAVAVTGSFSSAFPGGASSPTTRLVVLGSSNTLTDLMQLTPSDANAQILDNALSWLAQDEALLSIKNRTYRDNSLTLLQDPEVRNGAALSLSLVNLLLVPLAVLGWGLFRFLRRRSQEALS